MWAVFWALLSISIAHLSVYLFIYFFFVSPRDNADGKGGRNFESYSEDATLSGLMAAEYVNGVQSEGVAASPKHFVGNECEKERKVSNTIVDEKTLRELYAYAFQLVFKHSTPMVLMAS